MNLAKEKAAESGKRAKPAVRTRKTAAARKDNEDNDSSSVSDSDEDDDLVPFGYVEVFKQFKNGTLIRAGIRPRTAEDDALINQRGPIWPRAEKQARHENANGDSSSASNSAAGKIPRTTKDRSKAARKVPTGSNAANDADIELIDISELPDSETDSDISEDSETDEDPVQNNSESVRVTWRGQVHIFGMYQMDSVLRLKEMLSNKIGSIAPHQISVYKKDEVFPIEEFLTIQELNLEATTILEASRNVSETDESGAKFDRKEEFRTADPALVTLKIQNGNLRNRSTMVFVLKTASLCKLRELYINKAGLSGQKRAKQVRFMYDGEVVDLSQTPEKLGFEDGECLDVFIK